MFGPEHYTIGAYLAEDGEAYCPDCWMCETAEEEREAAVSKARLYELFSECGLECSHCGTEIVEREEDEDEDAIDDILGDDISLEPDGLGLTLVYAVMRDGARTLIHAHSGQFDVEAWAETRRESLQRLGVVKLEVGDTDNDNDESERGSLEK